ncbi:MAG: alpha-glucosidase/alpha-galactosidase [Chloroflexi bacterium]|nr:alpha-glucosidase/alpha-galactosidase [Chloroflexota bacterium]
MGKTKVVLIGAASASFGVNTLADLYAKREQLRGSEIALCDVDGARLARVVRLANRMNSATGEPFQITGSTDYREVLGGAEFVITSVEVDRLARWQRDWGIPFKYGVPHVLGENGGPGGLSHALRTIPLVLGIARDVEERAPNAFLINFTNPLARVCLALTRYTRLRVVGLCHQINEGYYIVGHVLGLAHRLAEPFPPEEVASAAMAKIDLQTAGLNHFTWIQSMRERATGRDLYPEFKARLAQMDPAFEPLSRRLYSAFGLFPTAGDEHVGEYFSIAQETSDLRGYDFEGRARQSAELDARVEQAGTSGAIQEFLGRESGERAAHIISEIVGNEHAYEQVVNVPNRGALPDLPDWAVVEVPGEVSAEGVQPLGVPPFPRAIAAVLNQQVAIQDRVVEAAVHGDRTAALQALLLDPVVGSYQGAEQMLDEFLAIHADLLPQFAHAKRS